MKTSNPLAILCLLISFCASAQSIRLDSIIETDGDRTTKEIWQYSDERNFMHSIISSIPSAVLSEFRFVYADSLLTSELKSVRDYKIEIEYEYDQFRRRTKAVESREIQGRHLYSTQEEWTYHFATGNEVKQYFLIKRNHKDSISRRIVRDDFYDNDKILEKSIYHLVDHDNMSEQFDTLLFEMENDSTNVVHIRGKVIRDSLYNYQMQRTTVDYTSVLNGDTTLHIFNTKLVTSDSVVLDAHRSALYQWGNPEAYQDRGYIECYGGFNSWTSANIERFDSTAGDTLFTKLYNIMSLCLGPDRLGEMLETAYLDHRKMYAFNDHGLIEHELSYIDTPWGGSEINSKRYYYTISTSTKTPQRMEREVRVITDLDRNRQYFSLDGRKIGHVHQSGLLVEMDQARYTSRLVFYKPQ